MCVRMLYIDEGGEVYGYVKEKKSDHLKSSISRDLKTWICNQLREVFPGEGLSRSG